MLAFSLLALLPALAAVLHHGAVAAAGPSDLRLSVIAGELAHRHVTIRCEGLSGAFTGAQGESGRTEFTTTSRSRSLICRKGSARSSTPTRAR